MRLQGLNVYNMALYKKGFLTLFLESNFLWAGSRISNLFSLTGGGGLLENTHRVGVDPAVNIYLDFN